MGPLPRGEITGSLNLAVRTSKDVEQRWKGSFENKHKSSYFFSKKESLKVRLQLYPCSLNLWLCMCGAAGGLRSQPGLGNECSALFGADPPPRQQLLFKPFTEPATFSEIYLKSISSPERDQTLTAEITYYL